MKAPDTSDSERFPFVFVLAGIACVVYGLGILAYQFFLWLKYAYWMPREFREAWDIFGLGDWWPKWAGLGQIVEWVRTCPLTGGYITIGIILIGLGGWLLETSRRV